MAYPIRVLHVDDDSSLRDLTATFLEREDDCFNVETAASADEGMERISDSPSDCIVSDYNMPGMDGVEFLQAVRENHPNLPFILYTGKGSEAVATEAIAADVTDYLQKGSGSEQYELLANRIRNAVQSRRETQRADRQEELMRLTEFASDSGGFEIDMETGGILLTDGAKQILTPSEDADLTIETGLERFHPEDREEIRRAIDRTAETGAQNRDIWRYQPPECEQRLLDVTFTTPSTNRDTAILRGAIHDVTDRKERERELRAEQRFIQQALDTLDDLLYVLDIDGRLQRWNNRFSEVTGYEDSELADMRAIELFPKDERQTIADAIQMAVSGEPVTVEATLLTADGERLPYEFTGSQLTDADRNTTGLVGIGRNLTGDKTREYRALAKEYEALLETSGDAIFMLDVDTTGEDLAFEFSRLSPGYETQTGISTEEVRGKTPQAVFGSERGAELEANYTRCVEQREPVSYREELNIAKDARMWETSLAPVIIDDEVIRVVGIARNVTEQVEREHGIQRRNDRLEEFASIVSHDLRNPLNVAQGRLQLAREECDSEHYEQIDTALNRMNRIIDDVLWLSREGRDIGSTEPVEMRGAVESAWNFVADGVDSAELRYATDESRLPTFYADSDRLSQLLENLLRNTLEHGGEGVTVTVGALDGGFYVEDDGAGIPDEERNSVFEAGYSTSKTGTGFGLSIVKQVADAHGWNVRVTNGSNGGARFNITGVESAK